MKPCIEQGKDGAIQIEGTNDGSESQYCLVTLLRAEGAVVAASAVITRARDLERAQKWLTSMQLVAGYFELFAMRRANEQSKAIAQSHQHVLQLATAVATADGFDSAAMNLCNELAARTGAARVAMGWVKGENIKLKALSHTEEFDKKQELSVQLVKVMEECLDNDEIVQFEPDGTTTDTVTREASILSRTQGGETILSLPLRRNGEVVGVTTLEFAPNQKIGPQAATGLAVAVELLAPQLFDRFQNDRWLITKVGLSVKDLTAKATGKKHMLAKTITLLVIVAMLIICNWIPKVDTRMMYHVAAPFKFGAREAYKISAPFDGARLTKVYVKAGDHVKAGDPLLEFDSTQLKIKQGRAEADAQSKHAEAAAYRDDSSKLAEAQMSELAAKASEADADLAKYQIEQCIVKAPYDGEILSPGDLQDRIDGTFKPNEVIMEMAKLDGPNQLRAELSVAESDIQDLHVGAKGTLATTALPTKKFAITIARIVPLGQTKENSNVFQVYADLQESSPDWRPGMEGDVRIDVAKKPMIWIWTHKFVDWVRIKLWI
jgi:hypothetical protein